ncbi:MAG: ACT domain-containing protein [Ruminococcaceae bacterium]|nr:ACT domain-containing protein [Oscillospiraceae bacterium]
MKAIVTVIAKDRVGIMATVANIMANNGINILDISQTIMQEYFTMVMLVDLKECKMPFAEVAALLKQTGEELELNIRIQREDIFDAMHRI